MSAAILAQARQFVGGSLPGPSDIMEDGSAVCSIHGKKRTAQNLEEDGAGGWKCRDGAQCNGGGGGPAAFRPGDWTCSSCGDHNFARNAACRACGATKSDGDGWGMDSGMGGKGWGIDSGMGCKGWGGKGCMGGCKGNMMGMGMMNQMWNMMGKGKGWGGGWDAWDGGWGCKGCKGGKGGGMGSSQAGNSQEKCSVHGRKRTMQNLVDDGMGGFRCSPMNPCKGTEDDWTCPACGDYQFHYKTVCGQCGNPKPEVADRASPY